MSEWVKLTASDGFVLDAYVARPEGTPKASVVVLQEIFGVNAHIRAVAEGYALAGYLAGVGVYVGVHALSAGPAIAGAVDALAR